MGDDTHHNGALMLTDAFSFLSGFDRPRPVPSKENYPYKNYYKNDEYSFFLKVGNVANLTSVLGDSIRFWREMIQHPNYDNWWKERCPFALYKNVDAAVLVVGGLFDAEDAYGTWGSYKALDSRRSGKPLYLLIGPWRHGGWRGQGNYLGDIRFGNTDLNKSFEGAEQQFFDYYLLGEGSFNQTSKATVFFTGENQWHHFSEWPAPNCQSTPIYLNGQDALTFSVPVEEHSYSEYLSDPDKPVPYTKKSSHNRQVEYMTEDQRFASTRPDVVTFETQPLQDNLTLGGELTADLWVSISTTDADFVVKLIDVFPDDFKYNATVDGEGNNGKTLMGGYQMLVRGDLMRGRYRNSFEHPQAFVPDKPERVTFKLADVAHTFLKGHRLMVQIQSSWFPLVDRNPQQFVDIYHCSDKDFISSDIKIFHQKDKPSRLLLPILK
jgi:putative CocE/NonD family hydrolase